MKDRFADDTRSQWYKCFSNVSKGKAPKFKKKIKTTILYRESDKIKKYRELEKKLSNYLRDLHFCMKK